MFEIDVKSRNDFPFIDLHNAYKEEKMDIENQVISLPIAKELRNIGVNKQSYFYWCYTTYLEDDFKWKILHADYLNQIVSSVTQENYIAAFGVVELLEILPIKIDKFYLVIEISPIVVSIGNKKGTNNLYEVMYRNADKDLRVPMAGLRLADCLAKMLIYLIENDEYDRNMVHK